MAKRIWERGSKQNTGGAEEDLGGGALRRGGSRRDGGGGEERRIWERGSERKREPGGMRVAGAGRNRERRMSHEKFVHVLVFLVVGD